MIAATLNPLLASVSRSFYLSLRVLPAPVRPAMGIGYLLCRTADTVADTDALPPNDRGSILSQLAEAFAGFPLHPDRVEDVIQRIIDQVDAGDTAEKALLRRLGETVVAFQILPRTDQALVQAVLLSVIQGMRMDLDVFGLPENGVRALPDEAALEKYLGWIGGGPGRFWTGVCRTHFPKLPIADWDRWSDEGHRFGTGLQMINILKDLPDDLKRGRCYLPQTFLAKHELTVETLASGTVASEAFLPLYHHLIDDTLGRLRSGFSYLMQLPRRAVRLRAAAWWPLAIGLKTLVRLRSIENPLDSKTIRKISRKDVQKTLASSMVRLPFNRWLKAVFEEEAGLASSTSDFR